jgi:hypothetical protein
LFGKLRLSHFEEALDLLAVEVTIEVHVQPNKQLFDASFTSPGEPTVDLIGSEKRDIVWLRRSKVGSEERERDKRQQVRERAWKVVLTLTVAGISLQWCRGRRDSSLQVGE